MAFGAVLGSMVAGAVGRAAGAALGKALSKPDKRIEESLFNIKQATKYKSGLYRNAASIAKSGAKFQADVYRQAGQIAEITAAGNVAQEQANVRRSEDAIGRQLIDLSAKNYGSAAANGVSLASKSVMIVQNEAMNAVTRTVVQERNDSLQRQSAIRYQAALTKMQYENEARGAIYSGDIQAMEYENKARAIDYEGAVEIYKIKTGTANQGGGSIGEAGALGAIQGFAMGF